MILDACAPLCFELLHLSLGHLMPFPGNTFQLTQSQQPAIDFDFDLVVFFYYADAPD